MSMKHLFKWTASITTRWRQFTARFIVLAMGSIWSVSFFSYICCDCRLLWHQMPRERQVVRRASALGRQRSACCTMYKLGSCMPSAQHMAFKYNQCVARTVAQRNIAPTQSYPKSTYASPSRIVISHLAPILQVWKFSKILHKGYW
jgi:hypothetical protein